MTWLRRFRPHGVFWRHYLRWAVVNVPYWCEAVILGFWTMLFLLWGPGRRGVMANLSAILPGSRPIANLFRVYRVMWNFAWTIDDNVRFKELQVVPDWEFVGREHFERMKNEPGGAIILTAHMGSYDLGANLFAQISKRPIVMVRAPEIDPQTRQYEEGRVATAESLKVDFSTRSNELALDLLHALQRGEIIAIQGDRITPGISVLPATLFGKKTSLPAGPFALSMAARVPVYPLFIVRLGRRSYRLVVGAPFQVERTRDRAAGFERAVAQWTHELEAVVREAWFQWYTFAPFAEKETA
ncbi:MAG TPA: lysophospholipid acyltransferase family protein [Thermoanaerobaculia bacterium]|nr:lysophospholipid acyltransferase family protein [Thermoanaerobaculia bacterium]